MSPPASLVDHQVAVERGAGFGRLAVERHGSGELRVGQVVDGLDVAVLVGVPADGHDAGVVGVVLAVLILDGIRDLVPGLHLVRGEVVGAGGGHGQAEVIHVRSGVGALVGLAGVHFLLGGGVRVLLVDLDLRILLLEAADHVTVVGPVVRKRDHVERAFLFGSGHEAVHAAEIGDRSGLCGLFVHFHGFTGVGGAIGGIGVA